MKYIGITFIFFTFIIGHDAIAEIYHNEQYGYDVDIPNGKTICTDPEPAPNHGFILLLDSSNCTKYETSNRIHVYASYNVITDNETINDVSSEICRDGVSKKTKISTNGLVFYQCKLPKNNLDITYFTLRPTTGGHTQVEFVEGLICITKKCNVSILKDIVTRTKINK